MQGYGSRLALSAMLGGYVLMAIAENAHPIPVELCRTHAGHFELKIPGGTTLMHGAPDDAAAYAVTLTQDAVIHSYADCVEIEAQASTDSFHSGDDLHPRSNAAHASDFAGVVSPREPLNNHFKKDDDRHSLTDRINWPG